MELGVRATHPVLRRISERRKVVRNDPIRASRVPRHISAAGVESAPVGRTARGDAAPGLSFSDGAKKAPGRGHRECRLA